MNFATISDCLFVVVACLSSPWYSFQEKTYPKLNFLYSYYLCPGETFEVLMDGTGDFLETHYAVCQKLYSFSEFGYKSDRKTQNYRNAGSNEVSISP